MTDRLNWCFTLYRKYVSRIKVALKKDKHKISLFLYYAVGIQVR